MAANRLNAPNQFETLSPPWILSQLDANATQNQAAWNDSSLGFMNGLPTDTGSANAYLITLTLGVPSSYRAGMCASFIPANSNTGPSTLTVSPLGSAAIVNPANLALVGGEICKNVKVDLVHDGTSFRIIGTCSTFINLGSQSTSQSVNCAGYTALTVGVNFTVASLSLALNNVSFGASITIVLTNSTGGSSAFQCAMTDPAGNALGVTALQSGQTNATPVAFNVPVYANGNVSVFKGTYNSLTTFIFSR